jgi:hypothetical protein
MESTVLELSRYTSNDSPSNGQWTNILVKPMTIDNGDAILLKQGFLDTQLIDSNSILIEQDVTWTIQFMYWTNNIGLTTYRKVAESGDPIPYEAEGLPYLFLDYDSNFPVIDDFNVIIKAGVYERSYLASYINRQLQGVKQPPNLDFESVVFSSDTIAPQYDLSENFIGFNKSVPGARTNMITPFLRPTYYTKERFNSMFYKDSNNVYKTAYYYPMCRFAGPSPYLNTDTNTIFRASSTAYSQIPIYGEIYDGGYTGASQVSLVFDDNGNNRYEFQYMHTPIIDNSSGGESVGTLNILNSVEIPGTDPKEYTTKTKTAYFNSQSGIFIVNTYTNLSNTFENDPFFKQLGFIKTDLITPEINSFFAYRNRPVIGGFTNPDYVPLDYYNSFLKYTTRNYMSMGDIISSSIAKQSGGGDYDLTLNQPVYTDVKESNPTYDFKYIYSLRQSTATEPIVASNAAISNINNAGHYLIELNGCYVTNYVNQENTFQIKGIVGSYYISPDSFVQSLSPDSLIYVHSGASINMSSLNIRILNPITKKVERNLGPNSVIYLQISKEKQQEEPAKK